MFEILFGWRKASKCKRLIRHVQCRLKLLRNKRDTMIRQLKDDVVELIKSGHLESTFSRIEQLYKDQNVKAAYDLLDHFCEFILINLPYIRKRRDCPNDVNEAVSSLLYASARCGDLPELPKLRKLFDERYGHRFAVVAVELLHGNLVNRKIVENLSVKSISEDLKLSLLKDIAQDNNLQLYFPETDEKSELQQEQVSHRSSDLDWEEQSSEKDIPFTTDDIGGAKKDKVYPLHEPEKIHDTSSGQSNSRTGSSSQLSSSSLQLKSESPSHFSEKSVVYLDDVEEFEPSGKEDVNDKDQRLFVFKSTISSMRNNSAVTATSLSGSYHDRMEPNEQSDGKTCSRGSSKRRKPARKRSKKRYAFVENKLCRSPIVTMSMKDIECALYYGESGDSSQDDESFIQRSHSQRKIEKNMFVEESLTSLAANPPKKLSAPTSPFNVRKVPKVICRPEMGNGVLSHNCKVSQTRTCASGNFNSDTAADCCFENPCYFIAKGDSTERRSPSPLQKNGPKLYIAFPHRNLQGNCHCSSDEEAISITVNTNYLKASENAASSSMKNQEVGCVSFAKKHTVRDYKDDTVNVVTPLHRHQLNAQRKEMEEPEVIDCQVSCASSHDTCTMVTSPWRQTRPPYMRAMTMPPERPKDKSSYQIPRSISSLSQQNHSSKSSSSSVSSYSHVHPKLPNYDDLAAQFKALKRE